MADYRDDVDFSDLATIEITKNIGGKTYVIREASGDAACRYRNAQSKALKYNDGKVVASEGLADVDPLLVSMCLFEITGPKGAEKYTPVPVAQIRAWPHRVQKYLVEKVKSISGLDLDETEESLEKQILELQEKLDKIKRDKEKNLLSATMDGSV